MFQTHHRNNQLSTCIVLLLTSWALTSKADVSSNLVVNAGFESGSFTSWFPSGGAQIRSDYKHTGSKGVWVFAGPGTAYQDIDLSSFASQIDAGSASIRAGGYANGFSELFLSCIFYDASNIQISSNDLSMFSYDFYRPLEYSNSISPGARKLRLSFQVRTNDSFADTGWDDTHAYVYTGLPNNIAHYVSPSGLHVSPFTNWLQAATNIQSAIDVAREGDTVLVTDGVYAVRTPIVVVSRSVSVCSVNGSSNTVIQGNITNSAAFISYYGSLCDGFSIRRSRGLDADVGAIIQNCSFSSNSTAGFSGGSVVRIMTTAILQDSVVTANTGGVEIADGLVQRCIIQNNKRSGVRGAGFGLPTLRNCMVSGNTNSDDGGGAYFFGNALVENCTFVNNGAGHIGGGIYGNSASIVNSIMVSNHAPIAPDYFTSITISNSCSPGLSLSDGNIVDNPQLVNVPAGDFHVTASSPCIDMGSNRSWMFSGLDFDKQTRLFNGRTDIGADEAVVEALYSGATMVDTVKWSCVVGGTYVLERIDSLVGATWQPVSQVITSPTPMISFLVTNDNASEIYRLMWIK